jgi:DNA-binding GntR family transcriptional regulator
MADNGIYAELKKRIVLLEYEPGQVLREKDIIQEFGVSRTPVREALIRLETEGLVRIVPNQGTFVSEISFQQLRDVFEIRSFLIRLTGQLAAARITEAELKQARGLVQRMKKEKSAKSLMRLDSELHELINRSTKNEVLVRILSMLRDQAVRIWKFSPSEDEYWRGLHAEFDDLLAALERRDEEASGLLLENHTKRFIEYIRSQFSW